MNVSRELIDEGNRIIRERDSKYREENKERLKEHNKQYREENKEKIKENGKQRCEKNREEDMNFRLHIIEYYGNVCSCCGEDMIEFLSIDHKNNDGAEQRKTHGVGIVFYKWIIANDYPDDLQILCRNCNWGKRVNNGVCPHKN